MVQKLSSRIYSNTLYFCWCDFAESNWNDRNTLIKRLLTSLALLFNLSLRGVSCEIEISFLSDFSQPTRSLISLAIRLDVLSQFKSLFRQCNIMWSGSKSQTVGFAWSCMHLNLAELNGQTLTRHLWFSLRVSYETVLGSIATLWNLKPFEQRHIFLENKNITWGIIVII